MRPGLEPGDRLIVLALSPRVGDVVAVQHDDRVLIKRVATVEDATCTVLGDNADASTDSRTFGPVARAAILGRAVYRYAPPARAGRLRYPRVGG
jgi:nickel-type superoxide dismutase maturation protease